MARPKNDTKNPPTIVTDEDTPGLKTLVAAANQVAAHSASISAQFGFDLPYDRESTITETKFLLAQSAEAMLEAGKRLVLIKENESHGDFTHIVEERLGMAPQVARRMMQAAIKYLGNDLSGSKRSALSVLGKTKLYELMVLDDEELDALAEGGTVAGLVTDDIDRMTSRELRSTLREAKETAAAKDKLLADKSAKIDDLATKLEKDKKTPQVIKPWDAKISKLNEEINMIFDILMDATDKLLQVKDVVLDSSFEGDRDQAATKMLALNYFDRTQRLVEAVALVQQVAFEDLDCYINAPKRQLITDENAG